MCRSSCILLLYHLISLPEYNTACFTGEACLIIVSFKEQILKHKVPFYLTTIFCTHVSFQISYASSVIELSNRQKYRNFFRTYPSDANFIPSIRSLMQHFGWERLAVITEEENLFLDVKLSVVRF